MRANLNLKIGSLFSGIGGLELGLEWAGLGKTIWQVEQDKYCQKILRQHWPEVKIYDDVCKVSKKNLEPIDILCGGFPCQDISASKKDGKGLSGSRSGLWYQYLRIIKELKPTWVVIENVASGARKWVDQVSNELAIQKYEILPIPLSAEDVGAFHLRKRIFIVGKRQHETTMANTPKSNASDISSSLSESIEKTWQTSPMDSSSEPWYWDSKCQNGHENQGYTKAIQGCPSPSPSFGISHGLSSRLDPNLTPKETQKRNETLGNAVVPQCSEVVGYVIRELINHKCEQ